MGGGVLVGHVGNAYNFGLSILFYGVFSSSTLLFIALIAKWLRRNNFVTVPDVVQSFRGRNKAISIFKLCDVRRHSLWLVHSTSAPSPSSTPA